VRGGDGQAEATQRRFDAAFRLRVREGKEQRDGDGLGSAAACLIHERVQLLFGRRAKDFSFGSYAFGHAETQVARHKAHRQGREPVVQTAACLAAGGDGVLKAGRGHKGDTRSLALEHGVGSDGRTVTDVECLVDPNPRKTVEHGQRGIGGSGENFQDVKLSG